MTDTWSGQPTQPLHVGDTYQPPPPPQPPKRTHRLRNTIIISGAVLGGLLFVGALASPPTDHMNEPQPTVTAPNTVPVTKSTTGGLAATQPTEEPTTQPTEPPTTAKPEPKLTTSQEQAIGTAQDYLDGQFFSRKGLIDQLKFEGYSRSDATFAVDSLHVNWREQAVGTAKEYLDGQHFSRSGLIEQLMFEGYSRSDAAYAVSEVGL